MNETNGYLLWDLAGTLVPYDPITGHAGALPDFDKHLPELAARFDMVVTTGEGTASARALLADLGLLSYFRSVFGDLLGSAGKPYGNILKQLRGDARQSLAIGDRLRGDLPADTDDLVTFLVNQNGGTASAGMIAYLIGVLERNGPDFPAAFGKICRDADPADDLAGPIGGGRIVQAWRRNDGFDYQLWMFSHDALDGSRRVVVV